MLQAAHQYPEDIYALLRKNEQQSAMCLVHRYYRSNSMFDVQEISTPQFGRHPMSYIVKLFEWWCDCGEFQALHLPCTHVMTVCSSFHLQPLTFVDPIYSLRNIFKAYEVQFQLVQNEDYWSTYTNPNLIPDPHMRQTNQEDELQLVSKTK